APSGSCARGHGWGRCPPRRSHGKTIAPCRDRGGRGRHGIAYPFVACRTIIDAAHKPLPPAALIGQRPDGTTDVPAVFRSLLRRPGQLIALVHTALDARIARAALRQGQRVLGQGLSFPGFSNARSDLCVITHAETSSQSPRSNEIPSRRVCTGLAN